MRIVNYGGTNLYVNSLIPFTGYLALTFFCFILYREEYSKYLESNIYKDYILTMINHENIHIEQIKDFGLLFKWCKPLQIIIGGILFYLIYLFEWIIRLFVNGPSNAYKNISFEKEAYSHELDYEYIQKERKHFNQWKKC
jgi:hypothetical protein